MTDGDSHAEVGTRLLELRSRELDTLAVAGANPV
jgi:hypothetical protein